MFVDLLTVDYLQFSWTYVYSNRRFVVCFTFVLGFPLCVLLSSSRVLVSLCPPPLSSTLFLSALKNMVTKASLSMVY